MKKSGKIDTFFLFLLGRVTLPLKNVVGVEYEHPCEVYAYTNEIIGSGESAGILTVCLSIF